ncbi:hypothetical protein CBR_g41776 [Chara braunii]|uniref:Uncharacterized protein n=1 Tax=Chara braunii TaxID=69332 RepID=A0A388LWW9_CHABU|nr:hypothetical protein CBR_g41776 [Chara braunii]|eukprot:GBG86712.1 hypothetical protein CBR_g41776 [Chara braunii]
MLLCINKSNIGTGGGDVNKWTIGVGIGVGAICLLTVVRMYGRGRGKKSAGRRGRSSNCGRYWMEGGNGFGQNPQRASNGKFANNNGTAADPTSNPPLPGIFPQQQFSAAPVAPPGVTLQPGVTMPSNLMQYQAPLQGQWGVQPWLPAAQWPRNQQWTMLNPPSRRANGQQQPFQQQGAGHGNHGHGAAGGGGKGPAANAFPGPGNRAYFTKEYMDIMEEIKTDKLLDEAKKKVATSRRSGVKIVEIPAESSRGENCVNTMIEKSDKTDEMKAWVTATLGDSLKLITEKLEEVDKKAKITSKEKEEFGRLCVISAAAEKKRMDSSSSEKRKRSRERTPAVCSPTTNPVKTRSRGSEKQKSRTKRIDISSDEEGATGVKQNLHAKMEGSSKLTDIKLMLASLLNGIGDIKGKRKVILPRVKTEPEPIKTPAVETRDTEDAEDVNVVQNKECTEDEE